MLEWIIILCVNAVYFLYNQTMKMVKMRPIIDSEAENFLERLIQSHCSNVSNELRHDNA